MFIQRVVISSILYTNFMPLDAQLKLKLSVAYGLLILWTFDQGFFVNHGILQPALQAVYFNTCNLCTSENQSPYLVYVLSESQN